MRCSYILNCTYLFVGNLVHFHRKREPLEKAFGGRKSLEKEELKHFVDMSHSLNNTF